MLDGINGPADLKGLSLQELEKLAVELRHEIVTTVTSTGGHLASNLGVVELTIALHRVFESPRDKIIWDVGHQSYVHKLLTGRRHRFSSLRQFRGLSGFTCRDESQHDPFGTGHASTSISAALGIAIARDLAGDDYHVIAVIGDGAITAGMAFEALNQAGHLGSRLIVVLNDNGMSISPTVGALAKLLSRVRFDHRYREAQKKGERIFNALPLGKSLWQMSQELKHRFKGLVMPTKIWEELGFTYIGPFDGHNITDLETALAQARDYCKRPTLIHVITTKGKGYLPAESNAVYFHGVQAKVDSNKKVPTYSEIFAQTILRLAREEPKLVVVTPAMPEANCLRIVETEFPERVFDVGICEQHAVTFAAGLATQGFIPVVAIYSTFLQRAFDQIIHDVCLQKLPVIFAIDRGGIVGDDGKTHQGTFDVSYLTLIPNLIVSAPKDENELQHLLYTAVKAGRPMAVRYPRSAGLGVKLDTVLHEIPVGQGEILRYGEDIAILALGAGVAPATEAARELEAKGIETAVINARFAKPLDAALLLKLAGRIKNILTIEENVLNGGFGSTVLKFFQEAGFNNVIVKSIGIPDEFIEHGSQAILRSRYGLDTEGIIRQVLKLFPGRSGDSSLIVKSNTETIPDNISQEKSKIDS
ncbi:MAG: 1-deoxy-D-xylulose-5-phosphate synthase [Chloroflexi bacterium RBG_16_50_9]|nr:MAG: 1-deoxy-D-xylulose-5-phosphate synthase [Chloroflexi bacterium RBG_16_50_9]